MLKVHPRYKNAYDSCISPIFQERHEIEIALQADVLNRHVMNSVRPFTGTQAADLRSHINMRNNDSRFKLLNFRAEPDDPNQASNETKERHNIKRQYASFEQDFLKLGNGGDDDMLLWCDECEDTDCEATANEFQGFVSEQVCGENNVFPEPPELTINFGRNILNPYGKMVLQFDGLSNILPVDFDVLFFFRGVRQAEPVQERDNEERNVEIPFDRIDRPFDQIVIRFIRMNRPNVRARLFSLHFWGAKVFPPEMLQDFSCKWDIDPTMCRLPQQSVSFTYHDDRDEFNPENPNGSFDDYVDGKPLKAQLITEFRNDATSVEQTPICDMQLSGETVWNNKTASFTGVSSLQMLNQNFTPMFHTRDNPDCTNSPPSQIPSGTTIQELFNEAKEAAFETLNPPRPNQTAAERRVERDTWLNEKWRVSPETQRELTRLSTNNAQGENPNRIWYHLPEKPLNQYLQLIAQALRCVVFEDAFGVIHLCKRDECIGANAPGRSNTAPANATITFNDIFGNPKYSRTVRPARVKVAYYKPKPEEEASDPSDEESTKVIASTITPKTTETDTPTVSSESAEPPQAVEQHYSPVGNEICRCTVECLPSSPAPGCNETELARALQGEIQPINNILICDERWARDIANHIFAELNLRENYNIEMRDGIALEPCDNISAEVRCFDKNRQETNELNTRPAFVVKKGLTFDGALRSELGYVLKKLNC